MLISVAYSVSGRIRSYFSFSKSPKLSLNLSDLSKLVRMGGNA